MLSTLGRSLLRPAAQSSVISSWGVPSLSAFQRLVRHFATIKVPEMGDSITEGTIMAWNKEVSEFVEEDDVVVEIETDKVTIEVPSPMNGVIEKVYFQPGDTANVGDLLFDITPGEAPEGTPAKTKEVEKGEEAPAAAPTPAPATTPKVEPTPTAPAAPEFAAPRSEKRVTMSRMRRRIAERLKDAQNTAALLTTFMDIDMTNLINLRSDLRADFEAKHGVRLGYMSAFVKASAAGIMEQPIIGASLDDTDIVYPSYVDISVAVATPTGLVVPVLRDCQDMGFADVERSLAGFADKARAGKITLDDMAGGTFTISNAGVYKSLFGTPIINPPQSAILGMHGIHKKPWVVDGKVEPRDIMHVCLTYDHRLIDGREAILFLRKIKECIEDPRRLLLDL